MSGEDARQPCSGRIKAKVVDERALLQVMTVYIFMRISEKYQQMTDCETNDCQDEASIPGYHEKKVAIESREQLN